MFLKGPRCARYWNALRKRLTTGRGSCWWKISCKKNSNARKPLPAIGDAVRIIKQHNGVVRVKELAASLHISQDAFEKRFRALIGSTPKQYASIIRLRNLITKYPGYASLTEATYQAGYFDQSHFIKDFGLSPGMRQKSFSIPHVSGN